MASKKVKQYYYDLSLRFDQDEKQIFHCLADSRYEKQEFKCGDVQVLFGCKNGRGFFTFKYNGICFCLCQHHEFKANTCVTGFHCKYTAEQPDSDPTSKRNKLLKFFDGKTVPFSIFSGEGFSELDENKMMSSIIPNSHFNKPDPYFQSRRSYFSHSWPNTPKNTPKCVEMMIDLQYETSGTPIRKSAELYSLCVMVTDGYLSVKSDDNLAGISLPRNKTGKGKGKIKKYALLDIQSTCHEMNKFLNASIFFSIVSRLPPDLQMIICNMAYKIKRESIPPRESAPILNDMLTREKMLWDMTD